MKLIHAAIAATALAATIGIFGASQAAQAPAPVVAVTGGQIRGAIADGQAVFLGVPYAGSPAGENRWKEAPAVRPWNGVKDANAFGPSCMQNFDFGATSEDCLSLNIWTGEWPSAAPKPVMVWIHGGGDTSGGTNTPSFFGDNLAKKGVVVVTINYRLGALGFLALPELSAESANKASGNYGLLDIIQSLRWVKENITRFGGDPNNVVVFGQSAGAENVQRLMISPLAKGLFHKAIAQSGALRRLDPTLADMEAQCTQAIAGLNAPAQGKLAFLRRATAKHLMDALDAADGKCRPLNLDGYVLPEQGFKVWAESRQAEVPFIGGNVARESYDEMTFEELKADIAKKYGDLAPRAYTQYQLNGTAMPAPHPLYGFAYQQWGADTNNRCRVAWQGLLHQGSAPFYEYEFQRNLPGQQANSNMHSNDVPYIFGMVFNPRYAANFTDQDREIAGTMQRYWVNFAKTGDPNDAQIQELWLKFDDGGRDYMEFGAQGPKARQHLRRGQCVLFLDSEKARPTIDHPERSARW